MFVYKIDVLAELKKAGYNTNRLRKEKIIGEYSIQALRSGEMVGLNVLDRICSLLGVGIEDVIQHEK